MLMVCPLMTVVTGALSGPIEKVRPAMTASEGPTEKVKPPAVTAERLGLELGSAIVVLASPIPCGPILTV